MSQQAGSFDAKLFVHHRNEKIVRLPEPSLPNGQRPNFGTTAKPKRNHPKKQNHQPQGPVPQQTPNLNPSADERDNRLRDKEAKPRQNRSNNNDQKPINAPGKNKIENEFNHQKKNSTNNKPARNNNKKQQSPLGTPEQQHPLPANNNNYVLKTDKFPQKAPSQVYAGMSYSYLAPDIKSLPKPTFS